MTAFLLLFPDLRGFSPPLHEKMGPPQLTLPRRLPSPSREPDTRSFLLFLPFLRKLNAAEAPSSDFLFSPSRTWKSDFSSSPSEDKDSRSHGRQHRQVSSPFLPSRRIQQKKAPPPPPLPSGLFEVKEIGCLANPHTPYLIPSSSFPPSPPPFFPH